MAQSDLKFGGISITNTSNNKDNYQLSGITCGKFEFEEYALPGTAYGARRILSNMATTSNKVAYKFEGKIYKSGLNSLLNQVDTIKALTTNYNYAQATMTYSLGSSASVVETVTNCGMEIDFSTVREFNNGWYEIGFSASFIKYGE